MGIVDIEIEPEPEKEKQVETAKLYRNNIISKIVLPRLAYKAIGSPKRIQLVVDNDNRYILVGKNLGTSSYFDIICANEVAVFGHGVVKAILDAMHLKNKEKIKTFSDFEVVPVKGKNCSAIKINY